MGLRNPFTFAFQPGTGRMFINDVGESTWEEINDGVGRRQLRMAADGRADHGRALQHARSSPTTTRAAAARSPAATFYNPLTRSVSRRSIRAATSSPTTAAAGSRTAIAAGTMTHVRHRHHVSGRSEGRRRREPLLPARAAAAAPRDRPPRDLRCGGAEHHRPTRPTSPLRPEAPPPSPSRHRARRLSGISGSATASTSRAPRRRATRSPRCRRRTTTRPSPPSSPTRSARPRARPRI